MATGIWVNIGSGNGWLPDGTKPLPEPMLDLSSEGFCGILLRTISQGLLKVSGYEFEKDILKIIFKSPRGQWVN